MSLDPTWLFLSLIPGGIGFVLLIYGKKQGRWPHLVSGLLFMAYPYVATTVTALLVGGCLIAGALWYAVRMGW
jgi:4-hydroxybenzoate polyprenyltransferase